MKKLLDLIPLLSPSAPLAQWRYVISTLVLFLTVAAFASPSVYAFRFELDPVHELLKRDLQRDLRDSRILQCKVPDAFKAGYAVQIQNDLDGLYSLTQRNYSIPTCEELGQ